MTTFYSLVLVFQRPGNRGADEIAGEYSQDIGVFGEQFFSERSHPCQTTAIVGAGTDFIHVVHLKKNDFDVPVVAPGYRISVFQ
jgi:hypothetical protein